jgi:hypothetical protein
MKGLLWVLFFCNVTFAVDAQRLCGTVEYTQQMIKANPSLQNSYNKIQQQVLNRPASSTANDTSSNQIITIPVVIHLLYNTPDQNISDAQILSQITVLNQDYRRQNADTSLTPDVFKAVAGDAKINFCLAQVDPQGRRTTGIIRKSTTTQLFIPDDAMKYSLQGGDDAWDCTKYLNIWVCNLISSSLGYGTMPGGPTDVDGIVVGFDVFGTVGDDLRSPFNKGRTATHEVGHWLGLRHTWGDANCGDDSIADTPEQESYNFGCPSFPHLSSCSPNANGDMFMNFMDFTDDGCMNIFTIDQVKEMRSLFAAGNIRNSFLTSFQCDSNLAEAGPLPVTSSPEDTLVTAQVVQIYPNPVHGQLTIESNAITKLTGQTLHIYNVLGEQVFETQLSQSVNTINLTGFTNGIYILRLGEGNNIYTAKIIKD